MAACNPEIPISLLQIPTGKPAFLRSGNQMGIMQTLSDQIGCVNSIMPACKPVHYGGSGEPKMVSSKVLNSNSVLFWHVYERD